MTHSLEPRPLAISTRTSHKAHTSHKSHNRHDPHNSHDIASSHLNSGSRQATSARLQSAPDADTAHSRVRTALTRRQACAGRLVSIDVAPVENDVPEPPNPYIDAVQAEPAYLPLSCTTDRVLRMLLDGDLARLRAEGVAESLGISCTTLRRRLRNDHTSYQFLLDRARQYRCESRLRERWLPGKCLADEMGYLEVNSFYRAFKRWTGLSYSEYKLSYH